MSQIFAVTLPKWGLEMSEGLLSRWLLPEGAPLEPGVELVDIETDKIVNTLDTEKSGVLRRILVSEGETVPVGALIAVIAEQSASEEAVNLFIQNFKAVDASFEPKDESEAEIAPPTPAPIGQAAVLATPLARKIASQNGINLSEVQGSGINGKVKKADLTPSTSAEAPKLSPEAAAARNASLHVSPIAAVFANELGLDLTAVVASGYKGRISLADAQDAAKAAGLWSEPSSRAADVAAPAAHLPVATAQLQPFTGMRKSIAKALSFSKQNIPHFYTAMDVEMDALMALRRSYNEGGAERRASLNDFFLRATALALKAHPQINIHCNDEGVTHFTQVDLCVAVAIDGGLVTPVIRNAADQSIAQISTEASRLIDAARTRNLTAEDLRAGTFTLSNLGMYGVRSFDAIINPPQGAIMAVGGPRREAREGSKGEVSFASVTTLTLSADHRGIDGALAAQFLQTVKRLIETPMSLVM